MKKRIIIPTMLSAVLALSSCVKDSESDSVKDLRGAHAEQLRAKATYDLSSAKVQDAMAKVEEAKAKEAEAMIALNVKAKELANAEKELENAAKAVDNAAKARTEAENAAGSEAKIKENIEKAEELRLQAERARKEYEAEFAAYEKAGTFAKEAEKKALEALNSAQIAILNATNEVSDKKAAEYKRVNKLYMKAVVDLAGKAKEIAEKKVDITGLEQGVVSAEAVKAVEIANKQAEIARLETRIATLEASKSKTTAELQAEALVAKTNYNAKFKQYENEFNSNKLEVLQVAEKQAYYDLEKTPLYVALKAFMAKYGSYYGSSAFSSYITYTAGTPVSKLLSNNVSDRYTTPYYFAGDMSLISVPYKTIVARQNFIQEAEANVAGYKQIKYVQDKTITDLESATNTNGIPALQTQKNTKEQEWQAAIANNESTTIVQAKYDAYVIASNALNNAITQRDNAKYLSAYYATRITDHQAFLAVFKSTDEWTTVTKALATWQTAYEASAEQYFKEQELFQQSNIAFVASDALANVASANVEIDDEIKIANETIAQRKKEIAEYKGVVTAEESVKVAKAQLAQLEAKKVELETEVARLKAILDSLT